jgi:hypothetical protein
MIAIGMRIPAEAAEEVAHLLVDHGVMGDRGLELLQLIRVGQLAIKQQVADLEEMRFSAS